jgi:hypothetical protein
MVRRIVIAGIAISLLRVGSVEAAPIMSARPATTVQAEAGDTIGWGYEVLNDSEDTLFFDGISATMPLASGTIDLGVFDFFNFQFVLAPHEQMQVEYAPGAAGLAEMTLSAALTSGTPVTGQIFLDYLLVPTEGAPIPGSFSMEVKVIVKGTPGVPEPATVFLLATGAAVMFRRRHRCAGIERRQ